MTTPNPAPNHAPRGLARRGASAVGLIWLLCCVSAGGRLLARSSSAPPAARSPAGAAAPARPGPRYKAIEDMRPGDRVASRDQHDRLAPVGAGRVAAAFRRTSDHLRVLRVVESDGSSQEIRTTDNHPFWVEGRGWVNAGDLAAGQRLAAGGGAAAGEAAVLASSVREEHPEGVAVYNFEVERDHTYFVAAQGAGGLPLWVHNDCAFVYRLVNQGTVVYYGIAKGRSQLSQRLFDHRIFKKGLWDEMQVIASGLAEAEAQNVEKYLIAKSS